MKLKTKWQIQDWTGKICDHKLYKSFDHAEYVLACRLGDNYGEDRQEYYIVEIEEELLQ